MGWHTGRHDRAGRRSRLFLGLGMAAALVLGSGCGGSSSGSGSPGSHVHLTFLAQFEQAHVMLNLAPLIRKHHVSMSIYRPALVALHSHDGAIYGLPKDWDTEGIFYDKTYFAQHHIKIPASLTWNPANGGTFLTLAREATIDKNGNNALSPRFSPGSVATYGVSVVNWR